MSEFSESRELELVEARGPRDRLAVVVADPQTMEVVGQRVMEGESLKQVARSWGVPVMEFVGWVTGDAERVACYEAALRVRGDEVGREVLSVADEGSDVARDALRVRARQWVAGKWDRERYGEGNGRGRGGSVRVVVVNPVEGSATAVAVEEE